MSTGVRPITSVMWTLARASNLPTVWSNVLAGWLLSGQGWHAGVGWALAGGALAYAGGCTLNDAFDARWDRRHRPGRPIPAGLISERAVWILGGVELAAGVGCLLGAGCVWPLVMALVVSILVYDWSHKRSSWAVIPMGLCRVFLGWAAASMGGSWWPPDSGVVLWLSALFAYIMGLTLVARGEAVGGRVPWSGLVLVMMPLVGTWWFNRLERADFRDFLFAAFLFGLGAAHVWGRLTHRADPSRVGAAVAKMLAGIVVVDALFIAQLKLEWAAGWAVLLGASLLWQKRVAAT